MQCSEKEWHVGTFYWRETFHLQTHYIWQL
jgi:hypothetical protein